MYFFELYSGSHIYNIFYVVNTSGKREMWEDKTRATLDRALIKHNNDVVALMS